MTSARNAFKDLFQSLSMLKLSLRKMVQALPEVKRGRWLKETEELEETTMRIEVERRKRWSSVMSVNGGGMVR